MPFVEFPFWASPGRFLSISAASFAADSALGCVLKLLLCGDHLAFQLQHASAAPGYPVGCHYCELRALIAASIFSLTLVRLKDADSCIGGNSMAVSPNSATTCWTKTNRKSNVVMSYYVATTTASLSLRINLLLFLFPSRFSGQRLVLILS